MRAMVYYDYGSPDVLQLQEIEEPVLGGDQVLVRAFAASVNWIDWHFLTGTPFLARLMAGLRKPTDPDIGPVLGGMEGSTFC